jgi:hypothetical protein
LTTLTNGRADFSAIGFYGLDISGKDHLFGGFGNLPATYNLFALLLRRDGDHFKVKF